MLPFALWPVPSCGRRPLRRRRGTALGAWVREGRKRSSACRPGGVPVPDTSVALHGKGKLDTDLHIPVPVLPWGREFQACPARLPSPVKGSWYSYVPDAPLVGFSRLGRPLPRPRAWRGSLADALEISVAVQGHPRSRAQR